MCSNTGSQVQGDENAVALTSTQKAPIPALPDIILDGFLKIKEAIITPFGQTDPPVGNTNGGLDAFLKTHGLIPENGQGGAFGYGILTFNELLCYLLACHSKHHLTGIELCNPLYIWSKRCSGTCTIWHFYGFRKCLG